MVQLSIDVPDELEKQAEELNLNLSKLIVELTKQELLKRLKRSKELKELDEVLKNSELTEEDCLRLGRELKERIWERHKQEGW